jgi:type IV pilus secretin PilQ/predicted competence protein
MILKKGPFPWLVLAAWVFAGRGPAIADDAPSIGPGGEKLITLQAAKTEIVDALRLVAEQGGLNLVIGPDISGQVSVYLENVPVETVLRSIAVNNGLNYTVSGGVLTISKPAQAAGNGAAVVPTLTLQTRVFTLQCQDAERIKNALEFALTSSGKIKVLNENSQPGYGGTRLSELGGDIRGSRSTGLPYGSSSVGGLGSTARTSTTGGVGTSLNADSDSLPRNARTLVVTDTEENLARIADLIADLDKMPPQVLIEARIVEMSTDLQRQLGIDWDVNVLANGPTLNHSLPLEWRAGFAGGSQTRYAPGGQVQTENPMSLGTIDFSQFRAMLRIHATDNTLRLLANPRLLIFNNHSASILVGERYPLLRANITDQGTLTESFDTYIPVGIQLEVTPTILADGRISMLVHPVTSSLGDEVVGTTGLRVRRILTREIDTRIAMHDGQTVVLGGLISDHKARTINKTPGLGDLPGLDVLFRQESPASQRVDLLVFLTARVEEASKIGEREQRVFDMYQPHFKQVERLQDAPLHFELPTEHGRGGPMFGDPPGEPMVEGDETE